MAADPAIGTRIKRARERLHLTQRQLAQQLGVDRKTVDNWENGRTSPRSSTGAIEQVLGIRLDDPDPAVEPQEEDLRDQLRRLEDLAREVRSRLDDEGERADERRRRGA